MKLKHPDSKQQIETDNPEAYQSQGWVEVKSKSDDKSHPSTRRPRRHLTRGLTAHHQENRNEC